MADGSGALRNNLPSDVTRFVGRRREIAAVRRLLGESRLVTLTGLGGTGKTRLALKVGAEVGRSFSDGVWFVDLAEVRDPEVLPHSVTQALGLHSQAGRSPEQVLVDHLRDKRALLVLDNCEHLIDASARLVNGLLQGCSSLHVLATSREALSIAGERILAVPPLPVPVSEAHHDAKSLAQYAAVDLFVDRAVAAVPTFALTDANSDIVARLTRMLEGLPLALELAAVRLSALSLSELEARLADRYRILSGGSRVAPGRHQTLRALMDWSFELCSPAEQAMWARLALFSGGFGFDAAEGICTDDQIPAGLVVDVVTGLVGKSILIRDDQEGRAWFRMLETVREYGLARLSEIDPEEVFLDRRTQWYADLGAQAHDEWMGAHQGAWIGRLTQEHPNLRTVLDRCLSRRDHASATAIVESLEYFWWLGGKTTEGLHWLDQVLAVSSEPTPERARTLRIKTRLCLLLGDLRQSQSTLVEASDLAERFKLAPEIAWTTYLAATHAAVEGDSAHAIELCELARALFAENKDLHGERSALFLLGFCRAMLGERDVAAANLNEALALAESDEEQWQSGWLSFALGIVAWLDGDTSRASELAKDSLAMREGLNDDFGAAFSLELLAWVAAGRNQFERAAALLGAADGVKQRIGASSGFLGSLQSSRQDSERQTRNRLGNARFEQHYQRGLALPSTEAFALGLEREDREVATLTDAALSQLTAREYEIAGLVTRGMTNPEIAAALVISRRTVESHVEHILTKLGFATRAQIAAWMATQPSS